MVLDGVVLLADQLVGLLVLLDDRVAHLVILVLQLPPGEVLHDAGPQRVAQHVGGGTQPVPGARRGRKNQTGRDGKLGHKETKHYDISAMKTLPLCLYAHVLIRLPALCISNL